MDENFTLNATEDLFSVSKRKQAEHLMPNSHFHSTYEAYYLLSGERTFFIKDRTLLLKAGDFLLVHPNVLHKTANTNQPEHEKIILNFKEAFLPSLHESFFETLRPEFSKEYLVIHFSMQHRLRFEDYLLQIVKEAQGLREGYDIVIQSLLAQLLVFASRHMELNNMEALEYINPMHERVSEIVRYINANYKKDLSLSLVADHFFVSPYYLSRTFKEVTGFSFVQYINSVRVKEAIKLLENTSLKVYTIAERVGFGSITHFGRIFREITGHSPLYYRKRDAQKG
ncbi:AraC family transcriptional regulator [Konateibacter massiliensis]|uniref:AraC family transcriptional regulator n=1 Tax=Konateibacter massiliensis TaxID=2002841 RepID=UPI000C15AF03|nr:AraC family transcriptional regulator [Konateibacter massiliensis]